MLELKHLPVSSFNENIAYIHRDCPVYKIDNIKTMTRIEIHGGAARFTLFCRLSTAAKSSAPTNSGSIPKRSDRSACRKVPGCR